VKKCDVPQDRAATLDGESKAVYAVDDYGSYSITSSTGWQAEDLVLTAAIEHYAMLKKSAISRVKSGQASSLECHMYDQRMDVTLLAQCTGLFRWRVRWHLRPRVFERLSAHLLQTYAEALGISVEDLKAVPEDE